MFLILTIQVYDSFVNLVTKFEKSTTNSLMLIYILIFVVFQQNI